MLFLERLAESSNIIGPGRVARREWSRRGFHKIRCSAIEFDSQRFGIGKGFGWHSDGSFDAGPGREDVCSL